MRFHSSAFFATVSSAAVLAAIIAGLSVIDSPSNVRAHKLDEQRVRDLQAISGAIERYRRTHDGVPEALAKLHQSELQYPVRVVDPVSQQPYEYRVTGASSYALCAQFDAASEPANDSRIPVFWAHSAGPHCFAIEVKPSVQH